VAELPLDYPDVVTLVGERVAAGVTEHMRMRLQSKASGDGRPYGDFYGRESRRIA
jgi:hypothetical protein